jgi:hypothetical protein
MRRTALSLDQQALLFKHHNEHWEDKPSYINMQEWAKENFQLISRSLVAKIIKNKKEIMEKNAEATQSLDQKKIAEVMVFEGSAALE